MNLPKSPENVGLDITNDTVVLYHDPCLDGFSSAWVVNTWFVQQGFEPVGDTNSMVYAHPATQATVTFTPAQYGGDRLSDEDADDNNVLLVDFSYPRAELEALASVARCVVVWDHHDSASKDLVGFEGAVFDQTMCEALLTHRLLFLDEAPRLLDYINDRDLWRWNLSDSREISNALFSYEKSWARWSILSRQLEHPETRDVLVAEGRGIRRHTELKAREMAATASIMTIGGYEILAAQAMHYKSEVCEILYRNNPEAIVAVWELVDGAVIMSLRTAQANDVSVSFVAKDLVAQGIASSGGGHVKAAGMRLEPYRPEAKALRNPWGDAQRALPE